jgi:hypothetical protein
MIAVTVAGTHTASFQPQHVEDTGEASVVFMVEITRSMYNQTWIQSLSGKQDSSAEHNKQTFVVSENMLKRHAAAAEAAAAATAVAMIGNHNHLP